jgi:hypothetical protein
MKIPKSLILALDESGSAWSSGNEIVMMVVEIRAGTFIHVHRRSLSPILTRQDKNV